MSEPKSDVDIGDQNESDNEDHFEHDREFSFEPPEPPDPLDTGESGRSDRATGALCHGDSISDRATGGEMIEPFDQPTVVLGEFGGSQFSNNEVLDGERTVSWSKGDSWTEEGNAATDFVNNYNAMVDANTIGADKYFHCSANCQASSRGFGSEVDAKAISVAREAVDFLKNLARGMTLSETLQDMQSDMTANTHGQKAGREIRESGGGQVGVRCANACSSFRPNGLP
ncbi:hypothetical protein ACOKV8_000548 [Vibrio parahaemolyticus]